MLATEGGGYRLEVPPDRIDAERLHALARRARGAARPEPRRGRRGGTGRRSRSAPGRCPAGGRRAARRAAPAAAHDLAAARRGARPGAEPRPETTPPRSPSWTRRRGPVRTTRGSSPTCCAARPAVRGARRRARPVRAAPRRTCATGSAPTPARRCSGCTPSCWRSTARCAPGCGYDADPAGRPRRRPAARCAPLVRDVAGRLDPRPGRARQDPARPRRSAARPSSRWCTSSSWSASPRPRTSSARSARRSASATR